MPNIKNFIGFIKYVEKILLNVVMKRPPSMQKKLKLSNFCFMNCQLNNFFTKIA